MPLEEEYRIGKFGYGLRNKNGNRLVGLLSAARLSWEFHLHEEGTSPVDLGIAQGTSYAEIDHILTNRRWSLLDV